MTPIEFCERYKGKTVMFSKGAVAKFVPNGKWTIHQDQQGQIIDELYDIHGTLKCANESFEHFLIVSEECLDKVIEVK